MPLDNRFGDQLFYNKAMWYLKFAWIPCRCELSDKIIWFKTAYCGIACWTGPNNLVIEKRWRTKSEHLLELLKR